MEPSLLLPTAEGFAECLAKRYEDFVQIADSGYGLYWIPQNFYQYWQDINTNKDLYLRGNMPPHYSSYITFQFSEILEIDQHPKYRSNIFLLCLLGVEKRIRGEMAEIKNRIYKDKTILPNKLFLLRFDRTQVKDKAPNSVNPDVLFKDVTWHHSFQSTLFHDIPHSVSVGVLENNVQDCLGQLGF